MRPVSPCIKDFLGLSKKDGATFNSHASAKVEDVYVSEEAMTLDSAPVTPSYLMKSRTFDSLWWVAAITIVLILSSEVVFEIISDFTYFMGVKPILLKSPLHMIEVGGILPSWLLSTADGEFDKFALYFRSSLGVLVLITISHRIVGYLFGLAVRYKLGTASGAFQVDFQWIAIRIGFDRSEVVLHNIKWYNPPLFIETPHFCTIEEVVVRFDLLSCLGALLFDRRYVAKIFFVEIDNAEVYIEKLHYTKKEIEKNINIEHGKSSYNFNCALNDTSEAEEEEDHSPKDSRIHNYISSIGSKFESAFKYSVGSSASPKDEIVSTSIKTTTSTDNSVDMKSITLTSDEQLINTNRHGSFSEFFHSNKSKNVLSDSDSITENINLKNKCDNILNNSQNLSKSQKEGLDCEESGLLKVTREKNSRSNSPTEKNEKTIFSPPKFTFFPLHHTSIGSGTDNYTDSKNRFEETKNLTEDPLMNNNFCNENTDEKKNGDENISETNSPQVKKKKSPHMGIKYRFEINKLILKDLRVHAEGALYATHIEATESKTIKLNYFTMNHKQLNKHEDIKEKEKEKKKSSFLHSNTSSSQKEKNESEDVDNEINFIFKKNDENVGSYADEILHRIINILQYEILSKNKLSLASNIFGAAANHVSANIKEVATSAKR